MSLIDEAASIIADRFNGPIETDREGNVVDWPFLYGMVALICEHTGLRPAYSGTVGREVLLASGLVTYWVIPEAERDRLCEGIHDPGEGEVTAEVQVGANAMCSYHLYRGWEPPRPPRPDPSRRRT